MHETKYTTPRKDPDKADRGQLKNTLNFNGASSVT